MIKAAQEREELQRTGDDLDGKIRRAEKEVAALEATLMQVCTRVWACACACVGAWVGGWV